MTIPKDTRRTWKPLREKGDIQKLVRLTRLSRSKVYEVLAGGECTTKEAALFAKFFAARKSEREAVTKQLAEA